ncbi:hypothetical protein DSCO28_73790 (plasmid) [Desulfosarcina ovata subsp. sediminis]|uniref:Uncharacterized protein n=1 Tax=Desulfosarcina ovata subsp. sediminis TaxID=885957 RepID=A0A5K8A2N8_9BACT|nr:hypothetical protein [Desulfosarcina ovata]BBO86813.1 hypothetical protein DSCO28_73790 [Desulfosarcina ovata subsp. sediminis]
MDGIKKDEAREWIIQKCNDAFTNDYEDWEGFDNPMTRSEMIAALDKCNNTWPGFEFRGHRIRNISKLHQAPHCE